MTDRIVRGDKEMRGRADIVKVEFINTELPLDIPIIIKRSCGRIGYQALDLVTIKNSAFEEGRRAGLEEAAKITEEFGWKIDDETGLDNYSGHDVAKAIRSRAGKGES